MTDKHTNKYTNIRTFQLVESIGPEGWCFENIQIQLNLNSNKVSSFFKVVRSGISSKKAMHSSQTDRKKIKKCVTDGHTLTSRWKVCSCFPERSPQKFLQGLTMSFSEQQKLRLPDKMCLQMSTVQCSAVTWRLRGGPTSFNVVLTNLLCHIKERLGMTLGSHHALTCFEVFNRPGVAGAVLQTPLSLTDWIINSLTHSLTHPLWKYLQNTFTSKP